MKELDLSLTAVKCGLRCLVNALEFRFEFRVVFDACQVRDEPWNRW